MGDMVMVKIANLVMMVIYILWWSHDGENCEDHEDCEVMCNHDVGEDDQEALSGVALQQKQD